MAIETYCSFLLLLENEPFELSKRTIESIVTFRRYAYGSQSDKAEIVCNCADAQTIVLPRLRAFAEEENVVVYSRSNWTYEQTEPFAPNILHLFSTKNKK